MGAVAEEKFLIQRGEYLSCNLGQNDFFNMVEITLCRQGKISNHLAP